MKDLLKFAGIGTGILLIFNYLKGRKEAMQNLKFVPVSIAIDSEKSAETGFRMLVYKVRIKLINQEMQPVIVRNVDLRVFYQNKIISTIQREQDFIVPSRSSQTIDMVAEIDTGNIIVSIVDLLKNYRSEKGISFTITGNIDTDLGRIPVQFTKKLL